MAIDGGTPATPRPLEGPPANRGVPVQERAAFRLAVLLASLVLIGVGVASWFLRPSRPGESGSLTEPRELETLAEGRMFLDLPVMTTYAPGSAVTGASSEVSFTMGPSFAVVYTWNPQSVPDGSIRFVLAPSGSFEQDAENAVRLRLGLPNRSTTRIAEGPNGVKDVLLVACEMTYVIKRMADGQEASSRTWLEIQYSLRSTGFYGDHLPFRNVTEPASSDLVPDDVGTVDNGGTGGAWSLSRSVRGSPSANRSFGHVVGRFEFGAGAAGIVTAELTSSFVWGPGDDYRLVVRGTTAGSFDLAWFWDSRFGSLLAVVSASP